MGVVGMCRGKGMGLAYLGPARAVKLAWGGACGLVGGIGPVLGFCVCKLERRCKGM